MSTVRESCKSTELTALVIIVIIIIIIIVAVQNLITLSSSTLDSLVELGRRISSQSGDVRETSYLLQRISVAIQRFNSVLLHDSLTVDILDL